MSYVEGNHFCDFIQMVGVDTFQVHWASLLLICFSLTQLNGCLSLLEKIFWLRKEKSDINQSEEPKLLGNECVLIVISNNCISNYI